MSGRHRKPNHTALNIAAISASGAFAVVPALAMTAGTAEAAIPEPAAPVPAVNWDPIIHCESGGNPAAQNPSSTASGLYQFLDSTWRSLGGTKYAARAKDATPEQQREIAELAYSQSGLTPWDASRGCWAGQEGQVRNTAAETPAKHRKPTPKPAPAPAPTAGDYVVKAGDTLARIATGHGETWQQLWDENRSSVVNPNLIYPGQHLHVGGAHTAPPGTAGTPAPAPAGTPIPSGVTGQKLTIELTGYSFQDNTPPGSATVSHPILHKQAGGTGTFDDPITVAVPNSGKGRFPAGTKFYLSSVQRYVIVEDTGASPAGGGVDGHLDMWIGGQDGTRAATDACMSALTGTVPAELNPPKGRPVMAGPIFAGGACHIPGKH
ncbi:MAG: hypothetical protein JWO67_3212 [Streptosporangiaceae bacterium]|nr:hypothetical protein [Streptosporangiaceae bacterium]